MNCSFLSGMAIGDGGGVSQEALKLTVIDIDYYLQHYIFPVQFILGVVGNAINLVVLLSSGMKNQANILLSAMAFADLGFLFCMLPDSLITYSVFYKSMRFGYFYFYTKIHLVAFANMFAVAATFLVLAVSLERFSGVRHPMHTIQLHDHRLYLLIGGIFSLAFILTFFQHLEYHVAVEVCYTYVMAKIRRITQLKKDSHPGLVLFLQIAKYTQSIVGIFLPVIAVAVLNVSLIYLLRKRQIIPRSTNSTQLTSSTNDNDKDEEEFRRFSDIGTFQRRERKVTATVVAIVTCFTVTHLPTLVPVIWERLQTRNSKEFNTVCSLLNMLLISGKVMNFFLFCSSSAHFRRRAILILKTHLCQNGRRKKYSSMWLSAHTHSQSTTVPTTASFNGDHRKASHMSAAAAAATAFGGSSPAGAANGRHLSLLNNQQEVIRGVAKSAGVPYGYRKTSRGNIVTSIRGRAATANGLTMSPLIQHMSID